MLHIIKTSLKNGPFKEFLCWAIFQFEPFFEGLQMSRILVLKDLSCISLYNFSIWKAFAGRKSGSFLFSKGSKTMLNWCLANRSRNRMEVYLVLMFVLISNNTILDASYSYHFLYKADILYSSFDTRGGKTDHFRVSNNRICILFY